MFIHNFQSLWIYQIEINQFCLISTIRIYLFQNQLLEVSIVFVRFRPVIIQTVIDIYCCAILLFCCLREDRVIFALCICRVSEIHIRKGILLLDILIHSTHFVLKR